ncbi:MAG: hypothetical protein EBZ77_14185, partial [Chitinophagia bacterium]|nr:hypothetical protein [Chitinophagia bacterium]
IFNQNAGGGGNLLAMPGVQFFISDCLPLSDMCIVNRNRKILWSALSEYHTNDGWTAVGQYRASVVASQAGLENVIWSQPKKGAAGAPKVTMR